MDHSTCLPQGLIRPYLKCGTVEKAATFSSQIFQLALKSGELISKHFQSPLAPILASEWTLNMLVEGTKAWLCKSKSKSKSKSTTTTTTTTAAASVQQSICRRLSRIVTEMFISALTQEEIWVT
ncbi:hypothetical protein BGZ82_002363 [Podila clonocystis]|nr:hypothetical protein BGZ82_002363 [Podila clonocystis]